MKTYAVFVAAIACGLMSGCGRREAAADRAAEVAKNQTEPGSYPLTGEIVGVDTARKLLKVKHEEVKGYMPAMTMEFAVSPGDLAAAKVGQRIRAEMIPSKEGDFHLEKIWPDNSADAETIASSARKLREDTHNLGKNAYREIGETAPDFALYDQDGRVVQSTRFRGKQVMLNFIFSRCPVPNMCPASTLKMTIAQKLAREAGVKNIEFVSITLDPTFDTPGVLKDYAAARGINTSNFSFLTGPEAAIQDLLTQFGVIAEFEGGLVKHTLATLLIDENGRIVHRTDNSSWDPAEFVAKMHKG